MKQDANTEIAIFAASAEDVAREAGAVIACPHYGENHDEFQCPGTSDYDGERECDHCQGAHDEAQCPEYWTCVLGDACVMPGMHNRDECHTAEDIETYEADFVDPEEHAADVADAKELREEFEAGLSMPVDAGARFDKKLADALNMPTNSQNPEDIVRLVIKNGPTSPSVRLNWADAAFIADVLRTTDRPRHQRLGTLIAIATAHDDPSTTGRVIATKSDMREWAIVELMGHRRLAGAISEQVKFGVTLLRIDVYPGDASEPTATQYYNGPKSLYALTPCDEATARRVALSSMPEPVARWELDVKIGAPGGELGTGDDDDAPW